MNQQHEDERSRIRAAMDRLLAGRPTAPRRPQGGVLRASTRRGNVVPLRPDGT
jgi:hypothetical protein